MMTNMLSRSLTQCNGHSHDPVFSERLHKRGDVVVVCCVWS